MFDDLESGENNIIVSIRFHEAVHGAVTTSIVIHYVCFFLIYISLCSALDCVFVNLFFPLFCWQPFGFKFVAYCCKVGLLIFLPQN